NTSVASASLSVTVDTAAPTAPSTPDLNAASDSGTSNTDNITNVTSPVFTGTAEAGSTVTIFDGTTAIGSGTATGGTYSVLTSLSSDGTHSSITAKATDAAGNTGVGSGALSVTLDTIAPNAPTGLAYNTATQTASWNTATDNSGGSGFDHYLFQIDNGKQSSPNGSYISTTTTSASVPSNGQKTLFVETVDKAGNTSTATSLQFSAPAGVSGQPINLALANASADGAPVTVTIMGVPPDWTIDGATILADGRWVVTTTDPASLTVTTAASFVGAVVLHVTETWTNADGTTRSAFIADNVEAYAPSSPIFAWSGDDTLTGTRQNDVFVFARPIGTDTIHAFGTDSDRIDLIGFAGVASFADLAGHIADDINGNAVITVGSGETITLAGIHAASVGADNFMFDQEPVTMNAGTIAIADGAMLPLGGTIENTGTIALGSTGLHTHLEVIVRGVTLEGGGHVTLSDDDHNGIFGGSADATLINVDNTITGAGNIGEGQLTLINQGTILANGTNALIIDTGSNAVTNAGVLEATGSGGLVIDGGIANSGNLWANGGNVKILGDVTGTGTATISGTAMLEFGGTSAENTTFDFGAAGTLKLDQSAGFTGAVSGFGAGDVIDLADFGFGSGTTLAYVANATNSGGTLSLSNGVHGAAIQFVGHYATADFLADADHDHGTLIHLTTKADFAFV
ncbi:MAG: hypothetical protein JWM91_2016, partial [Rhodospirillales bacterium]|nr:hypothetical protein [Rhodospirillales bacterium]